MRVLLAVTLVLCAACASPERDPDLVATFSIAAVDTRTGELGIAVASKFIAVGAVVPWAKAKVGAIATQSYANTTLGPEGLAMLEKGHPPGDVLDILLEKDPDKERRQAGIVTADGQAATRTGKKCHAWAGGHAEEGLAVQGNILTGREVIDAMVAAYKNARGDLGERLLAALQAGEDAGGDSRGRQSAALLVVRDKGGYAGQNDRYRDLRVDDHKDPIPELKRIYKLHKRVFPPPD